MSLISKGITREEALRRIQELSDRTASLGEGIGNFGQAEPYVK
jgi:hypothetical protein